jgi:ADP-heptose:LPS heptosyltransferase
LRFPDARIVFVSLATNRELLDACPDVDDRIYVRDEGWLGLALSYASAVRQARKVRPDLCIDFEQFARASVVLATLAGARQVVGLATPGNDRSALQHKTVPYDDRQHMGQTYLDLARAAGVRERHYRPLAPEISASWNAEAEALTARLPRRPGPLIVMHPGSGDNFPGRRWPSESFAVLADRLVEEVQARVVVTGTRAEAALTARVVGATRPESGVADAAGCLGVGGLVALLARADVLVTNDTAPVHLGSALGLPVFAFFGPNTPDLYGPLSPGSHAFYRDIPCSPCLTNLNYKTSLCRMPVCVRDIAVEEVVARVRAHLARTSDGTGGPGRIARTG